MKIVQAEGTFYFPVFHQGQQIVYKKYNDFFMAHILAEFSERKEQAERKITLSKEQFIEASKTARLASVIKNRKQQMELRNNFCQLPNVYVLADGSVEIHVYTKETVYTRVSNQVATRAIMTLIERGKEAMGLMATVIIAATAGNEFCLSVPYLNKSFGSESHPSAAQRAKYNKLIDLFEEVYPEFNTSRQEITFQDGLKPAKCLVGRVCRLTETAERKATPKAAPVQAEPLHIPLASVEPIIESYTISVR